MIAPAVVRTAPRLRRSAMLRPFVAADIPQVAHVHRAAFGLEHGPNLRQYRDYFTRVFLENPAADGVISSLVYEQEDGRVVGFVGLVPRRFTFGGRSYRAAVSSQFIVDPASHVGLVALRLARAYVEGPQDVSIADEANEISRRMWQGLGGTTALLLSMQWTRALRPARLGLSYLRQRRALAPFAMAARPAASLADALATRIPASQLYQRQPSTDTMELSAGAICARAAETCPSGDLCMQYDEQTMQWLLERVSHRTIGGQAVNAIVKRGSTVLGWYVAHMDCDGVVEVAHLDATSASIDEVLDHLFFHAWRLGAVSVNGRMMPRFAQALSDKYCVFHRRGPWVLIKSQRPELVRAFESGAACLSPLDGEWSLRFQPVTR